MTITYDPFNNVWVASGRFLGHAYVAEGDDPGEAYNAALTCAHEAAKRRGLI